MKRRQKPFSSLARANAELMAAFAPSKPAPVYLADRKRHLVCYPYGLPELHRMAEDLGLDRRWFDSNPKHPHYVIPLTRLDEIFARCRIVRPRQILAVIRGGQP